jgi:hypothetical protein
MPRNRCYGVSEDGQRGQAPEESTMHRTRVLRAHPWTGWACRCLLLMLFVCVSVHARADAVSGRVYGPDEKPLPNMVFVARSEKGLSVRFKTDASGSFSVYLDPGRHTVHAEADESLEGSIESYSQPVQQDIHMRKKAR